MMGHYSEERCRCKARLSVRGTRLCCLMDKGMYLHNLVSGGVLSEEKHTFTELYALQLSLPSRLMPSLVSFGSGEGLPPLGPMVKAAVKASPSGDNRFCSAFHTEMLTIKLGISQTLIQSNCHS